jgi:hypothetical protein
MQNYGAMYMYYPIINILIAYNPSNNFLQAVKLNTVLNQVCFKNGNSTLYNKLLIATGGR